MRSAILAGIFALGAAAAPKEPLLVRQSSSLPACMDDAAANKVAGNFKDLINLTFNTTLAETALTESFDDYSDGVNELINYGNYQGPCYVQPLGTPTFTDRASFIKGQSGQPPIPFEILNTWHTCDTVIIRWRSSNPGTVSPEQIVTGVIVLETEANADATSDQPFQIATVYSEFNSGAWLYDLGFFLPTCSSSRKTRRSVGML